MDHRVVRGALGGVNKVHLVHVEPRKFDSIGGYKNKNTRCCDGQNVWQAASAVQHELPEATTVGPACRSRLLFTVYGLHLLLLCMDTRVIWHRFQTQVQMPGGLRRTTSLVKKRKYYRVAIV